MERYGEYYLEARKFVKRRTGPAQAFATLLTNPDNFLSNPVELS